MKIEGWSNEEEKEIRFIVSCDDDNEMKAFQYFFGKMLENMSNEANAVIIDAQDGKIMGNTEGIEDKVVDAMRNLAEHLAKQSNAEVPTKFRSKFQ